MNSLKTLNKVKANQFSPKLRARLGLNPGEKVSLTVKRLTEKDDPWLLIRGSLTTTEAEALRTFSAASRRSRKTSPQV